MKLIDLTHSFTDSMPVYPGDPAPTLVQVASIEKEGYTDHNLSTVMHVGTHMDAPLHMIPNGKRMDEIPLNHFFGQGVLIDARNKTKIDASIIPESITEEAIVLIFTGFGSFYRDASYFENLPEVTEDFAKRMVELKVKIVGMDILGPDQPPFSTHKILLGNGILIIENLTRLEELLNINNFEIIALPMKFNTDAAPVRVLARFD